MSDKQDGGPAFPMPIVERAEGGVWHNEQYGMSLRDWFAGMALQGNLSCPMVEGERWPDGVNTLEQVQKYMSRVAYGYADAMLAARSNP